MTATTSPPVRKKKATTRLLPLAMVGGLLLLALLVGVLVLGSGATAFDRAFDSGADLPAKYAGLASFPGSILALLLRLRWILGGAGCLLLILFLSMNRQVLYSQQVAPYVFILPFLLTFLVFFLYPFFSTLSMSFHEVTGSGSTFIGWQNYQDMFGNRTFYTAVTNSARYMLITCALLIPFPMVFAYLINSRRMIGAGFFKAVFFLPVLCSVVVAGIVFRMMFSELPGALMNQVSVLLGGKPQIWLKGEWTAMFAMVLLCCWRWTGMNILYYMAGLKSIPAEMYEAAEIDGAGAFQRFRHVAVPLLKPTTIYVLTISIYAGLAMFTESYMIFGTNTSPKNYGLTIVGYLYRYGFEKVDKFGFASAVGLVLLFGSLIITVLQLWATGVIGRRKEA